MPYTAIIEHGNICRSGTNIHYRHAQFLFIRIQRSDGRSQGLEYQSFHVNGHFMNAVHQILCRGGGHCDQMYFCFQAPPGHTHRILDTVHRIDQVFLGQDVQDLPVNGQGYRLGQFQHPGYIVLGNFLFHRYVTGTAFLNGNGALGIDPTNVITGDGKHGPVHLYTGHQFGFPYGSFDGVHDPVPVHDRTFLDALGRGIAYTEDLVRSFI